MLQHKSGGSFNYEKNHVGSNRGSGGGEGGGLGSQAFPTHVAAKAAAAATATATRFGATRMREGCKALRLLDMIPASVAEQLHANPRFGAIFGTLEGGL